MRRIVLFVIQDFVGPELSGSSQLHDLLSSFNHFLQPRDPSSSFFLFSGSSRSHPLLAVATSLPIPTQRVCPLLLTPSLFADFPSAKVLPASTTKTTLFHLPTKLTSLGFLFFSDSHTRSPLLTWLFSLLRLNLLRLYSFYSSRCCLPQFILDPISPSLVHYLDPYHRPSTTRLA